jgi:hypothetical protein
MKAHREKAGGYRRNSDVLSVILKREEEGLLQARYLAVLNSGYQ